MLVGDKKFGVLFYLIVQASGSILPQKMFVFFHP